LIEYANSTLKKDLNDKKRVYAEAGIGEYWVVNLQTSELIVFRDLDKGAYQSETILVTGNIAPLSFPDLQIKVIQLFTI
jgi:Uma2 family endonuclease